MSEKKEVEVNYPSEEEFLIKTPIYKRFTYDKDNYYRGQNLINYREAIDTYCPECNSHSIFNRVDGDGNCPYPGSWLNWGLFSINYLCSRDSEHKLKFLFLAEGNSIEKIGQYPSMADLHLYDVKKYSKALDEKYFKEFTKAIGLMSHGVGVGSFVYLRRIFEFLIEESHLKLKTTTGWDEEAYNKARIADKIKILEPELPVFLVENKGMYSILSKGIHELSEEECLEAFPIVKLGIELILDEKLEKIKKDKKVEEAKKAIQALKEKHS